jgi:hypothetical protein
MSGASMMKRSGLWIAAGLLACAAPAGAADPVHPTAPLRAAAQKVSTAATTGEYRLDPACHVYASYPGQPDAGAGQVRSMEI